VAIVDVFSRNVLSWQLSNSLDTEFCMYALDMALGRWPQARGISLRSGLQVHVISLHCEAAGRGDQDQLVWKKALLRQHPR
jgi:transposase InsO family protein